MRLFAILIPFAFITASSAHSLGYNRDRIIGGSDAKRRQFPYMVSVQIYGRLYCGGTVVSRNWVVSAGHCYEDFGPETDIRAVAGLLRFREDHPDVQSISVVEIITHPQYVHILGVMVDYDISLLRLATPLTFTEAVQPLALPPLGQQPFGNAWLTGWGIFQVWPSANPSTMQYLKMPIVTKEECQQALSKFPGSYQLLDSMICVLPPKEAETGCYGDSGGPLARDGVLVGIASWIAGGCGVKNAPTVFTRVSAFVDFINEIIKNDV